MTLQYSSDYSSVELSQKGYISEILDQYNITRHANSPAKRDILDLPSGNKNALVDASNFKSQLMKIAYLSIRTRPDLRFVVGFLATKSTSPTVHDQECLDYLYAYLNSSKDLSITICPTDFAFTAYVDASFAIHNDGKGHTGIVIKMGLPDSNNSGPLYCQSSKQKLIGMNSTETELIAINDSLFTLIKIKSICIILGFHVPTITVFQDNTSTMHIAIKGEGNTRRSKYMLVRVSHITEEINNGLIVLKYLPTAEMIADILTKPLYGRLFSTLMQQLLNYFKN
jgi:hypothetical protein